MVTHLCTNDSHSNKHEANFTRKRRKRQPRSGAAVIQLILIDAQTMLTTARSEIYNPTIILEAFENSNANFLKNTASRLNSNSNTRLHGSSASRRELTTVQRPPQGASAAPRRGRSARWHNPTNNQQLKSDRNLPLKSY